MALIPLYPYQKRYINDKSRFKIAHFARQCGKTFTTTLELVDDCFEAESRGKRTKWIILSRGERQAREAMLDGVIPHCKAYSLSVSDLQESEWHGDDGIYKSFEVELPHGSRIIALPANPDTARGYSANVFLDEFARHQNSRKIWGALYPVISAGYKLRIASTGNGKANKFYEIMSGTDSRWSRHSVDIHQAVADGLPRDIDELREGLNDEDMRAQEYCNEWLDEAGAWLSFDLINSVEHDDAGIPSKYMNTPVYIGNDIARRNDLWVAWVWEPVGDVFWTREIVTLKRQKFSVHDATMDELFERYRVARLCMDQTGMGEKPVEDAQKRYGEHCVEGVLFTPANKLVPARTGKEHFEDRTCRIPMGDQALRADLHKLKKMDSPAGAPRFIVESDGDDGGDKSHADRAWSGFLGLYAGKSPVRKYAYEPVRQSRDMPGVIRATHGFKDESVRWRNS